MAGTIVNYLVVHDWMNTAHEPQRTEADQGDHRLPTQIWLIDQSWFLILSQITGIRRCKPTPATRFLKSRPSPRERLGLNWN